MKRPKYEGILDRNKMSQVVRYAYESYNGQKAKCNNPKNRFYKNYGGKGIRVEYDVREFIGWWVKEFKTFKGSKATCGRIDHSKSYNFDNIIMQDSSDNSREALVRNGLNKENNPTPAKPVELIHFFSLAKIGEFISGRDAARKTGINQAAVHRMCTGKQIKTRDGFTFKFKEAA